MADNLGLDYDEVVILKETSVAHGGVMAIYTDELVLTNKKLICVNKGMFGGTKKIYHYPLDQIKVFNGVPQVQQGKLSNGTPCLDVYLVDGEEHFNFQTKNKQKIALWIEEIRKRFGGNFAYSSVRMSSSYDEDIDEDENSSEDDDSLLGAFKEVGEEFKDVGIELADAFGIKLKKKNKSKKTDNGKANVKTATILPHQGIKCATCGKVLGAGSRFCPACGASVRAKESEKIAQQGRICPVCGKKLDPSLRFCTECGTDLSLSTKAEVLPEQEDSIAKEGTKESLSVDKQIELLQKLKSLVDAGVISQEEFEQKKKEIL